MVNYGMCERLTSTTQQLVLAPLIWLTALCMVLGDVNPSTPSVRMISPVERWGFKSLTIYLPHFQIQCILKLVYFYRGKRKFL